MDRTTLEVIYLLMSSQNKMWGYQMVFNGAVMATLIVLLIWAIRRK